jgi:hypothetical protein
MFIQIYVQSVIEAACIHSPSRFNGSKNLFEWSRIVSYTVIFLSNLKGLSHKITYDNGLVSTSAFKRIFQLASLILFSCNSYGLTILLRVSRICSAL